jgi:amino acid transporter
MGVADVLLGRPLASSQEKQEKITPARGVPTFGLDALSSAAYGPEAALTILLPLGAAGSQYIGLLMGAVIALLLIVYFSYRQTIAAYPTGGGSYTVAKENLGQRAGLLAAAALMTDYLLNVAVGISAGVGALVSAVPSLHPHTLLLCLGVLAILTIVNLRGVREAGAAFIAPTCLFVGTLVVVIVIGLARVVFGGGHPHPVAALPPVPHAVETAGVWLLLRSFASGCSALTGVEAVSNGVQAFREPVVPNARKTLFVIVLTLVVLLGGIAALVHAYGITATDPTKPGYQSTLSLMTAAVVGRGAFYGLTMFSVLVVLSLSANTSFAGFPRICQAVALDNYLPHSLTSRGRRLVYSQGIIVLAFFAAVLLIIFGGVTDRLIPLFAVGAFLAFTLSQAGMVAHWRKKHGSFHHMLINGIGACATAITVLIVVAAKFTEGAWVVVLLLPSIILLMNRVHRHYKRVGKELEAKGGLVLGEHHRPPIVIVPISDWNAASQKTLRFALTLSPEVQLVHVLGEHDKDVTEEWRNEIAQPARAAGLPVPKLVTLRSPYRSVLQPLVDYVLKVEKENQHRTIAVAVSTMVEQHWYHYFLHNQRGELLTAMLLLQGDRRINIVNVPWYLKA